jgi:hypothetical protein
MKCKGSIICSPYNVELYKHIVPSGPTCGGAQSTIPYSRPRLLCNIIYIMMFMGPVHTKVLPKSCQRVDFFLSIFDTPLKSYPVFYFEL